MAVAVLELGREASSAHSSNLIAQIIRSDAMPFPPPHRRFYLWLALAPLLPPFGGITTFATVDRDTVEQQICESL